MALPFLRFKRNRSASPSGLELVRSIFSKFQRIQKLNTRSLELMAEMEQALGGEYIFDRAFLESSVRQLSTFTYQVVYSLNAMSQNRYVDLFDRFQGIKSILEDVLGGGLGPFASSLTLPYSTLGWEMEPLAGALNVCLAEARLRMDLLAPDGFAVTSTGCRLFMESNGLDALMHGGDFSGSEETLKSATFPPELEQAIQEEVKKLLAPRGGSMRFTVRACTAGGYGREDLDMEGMTGVAPEQVLSACKIALAEYITKTKAREMPRPENGPERGLGTITGSGSGAVALAVHETVPAKVAGSISFDASAGLSAGLLSITATPVDTPDVTERYFLQRTYPYDLVRSEIRPRSQDEPLYSGTMVLSRTQRGLYRGSALLKPDFLKTLAEAAMTFERMLGCIHELRWVRGDADRPVIVSIHPYAGPTGGTSPACDAAVADAIRSADLLLKGGETVQTGISAGKAVHVSENDDLELFPHGAIAVARVASPRLSPILRRASAIVTELGTSIGHLATVARELRVPAIFGASEALERVPDGAEVTVDAGERMVLRGIIEPLLACRECSTELYPSDPEYVALRRLLRWIMPLALIDPESSDFTAAGCQTYHDIIHFAHERSVEELLHIQDRGRGLADLNARKLDLGVPVDLFVIDLGGGISSAAGATPCLEDVRSEPLQPFLRGLTLKEMWDRGPASIRLRDIFSGLDRTFSAMTSQPEFTGMNHAIVAENYMNLGLRLGYHFSVVDSYLCPSMSQNYIYFRFVGGFADEKRRGLRARLIRTVLEDMRFKVLVKGDLVVGKLKIADREEMASALTSLGELTGFTRQLDMAMASEEMAEELTALFRRTSNRGTASRGLVEVPDA